MVSAKGENCCTQELLSPISSHGILVGCVDSCLYCIDNSGTMISAKGENCCTQDLLSPSVSSHGILVGCVDSTVACIVLITREQW